MDVCRKDAKNAVIPKGYKLVQTFDDNTAGPICDEVNRQLINRFKLLKNLKRLSCTDIVKFYAV